MTAATQTTPSPSAGGRPRDPSMAARIRAAVVTLLAERGMGGFTVDDIAAQCNVGKASIYRRWSTLADILAKTVRGLGVREEDVAWSDPGTLRGDLIALLTAATTGARAAAELAVLSSLPYRADLRQAYTDGPLARLAAALDTFHLRVRDRGDRASDVPRSTQVQAAIAWLNTTTAHTGTQPDAGTIVAVVDVLLLPSPAERWAADDTRRAAEVAAAMSPGDSIRRAADEHGLPYEALHHAVAALRPAGPPYPPLAPSEEEWAAHLDTLTPREPGR